MTPLSLRDTLARACAALEDDTLVQAARVDIFFHLLLRDSAPNRFHVRNLVYPAWYLGQVVRAARYRRGWGTCARGDVLFVIQYGATAGYGTLAPLFPELSRRRKRLVAVVTDSVFRQRNEDLRSAGFSGVANADAAMLHYLPRLFAVAAPAAWRAYRRLLSVVDDAPLRCQLARSRLVIITMLLRAYVYRSIIDDVLRSSGVRAMATHCDFMPINWQAVDLARKLGIGEYTLQHGSPSLEHFPIFSHQYVVWGDVARDAFVGNGAPREHLRAWGCPRMDATWQDRDAVTPTEARARLIAFDPRLAAASRIMTFISHSQSPAPTRTYHRETVARLRELWKLLPPGNSLILKLHPQETDALYRKVFASDELGQICTVRDEVLLATLLRGSDTVVSPFSTVLLEAMLLNTPIIQANFPAADGISDYSRAGGGIYAESVADVLASHERLADATERERVLRRQREFCARYFANLGRAAERVVGGIVGGS